jgi:hypothetical protein
LIQFSSGIGIEDLKLIIDRMERQWDMAMAKDRSAIAGHVYDFRAVGMRLEADIQREFRSWKAGKVDQRIGAEVPGGASYPL